MRSRVMSDSGFSSDSTEACGTDQPFDLGIEEKIKILQQRLNSIRSAKVAFLQECLTTDKNIEDVVRSVSVVVQEHERELKCFLQKIARSKILEWDRQLKVCQEAETSLKNIDDRFIGATADVQDTANTFAEKIGFIDAGDLRVDVENMNLWNIMETFGRFSENALPVKKPSENPKPRLVLEDKRFNRPWGVCSDRTGRVLVADCGNNRIQVFNEFGYFLFLFGGSGTGPGEFDHPTGIAVDNKLRIFVCDKHNHRIQVFTYTGGFLLTFGEKGTNAGQFLHPWDVAINQNGEIAVSDTRNHRIQLFDSHGGFISQFGFGISPTFEFSPRGVAFKHDGALLVTDFHNHCVFVIDKHFTTVSQFHRGNFFKPQGIACNSQGVIAVADGRNNIQVYDELGNLSKRFGKRGKKPGEFDNVQGVCFQPDGGIAVADCSNRIHIF